MRVHKFSSNESFFLRRKLGTICVRKLPLADILFLVLLLVGVKTVPSVSILRLNGEKLSVSIVKYVVMVP
jgi:hypothetical protein